MLYCQQCGAANSDDARFCNQCGGKIAHPGEPGGPLSSSTPERVAVDTLPGHGRSRYSDPPPPIEERAPEPRTDPHPEPRASRAPSSAGLDVSTISLSAIGVRSRGKAWSLLIGVALVLIALGAGGSWLVMRTSEEPVATVPNDPVPSAPEEVEIGDPVPEGAEVPDLVTGAPRPSNPRSTSSEGTQSSGTRPSGGGRASGSSSSTASGSSGSTSGGGGGSASGGGGGSTSGGSTSGGGGGTTSGGGGGSTPEGPAPDWEALEAELDDSDPVMDDYSSRVRQVVRSYYARRAQSCFDHESRNNQSVRGTVVIGFEIRADGELEDVEVVRNTTGIATLGQCLARQVDSWRFPPPPDGEAPLAMQMPFSR